MSLGPINRELLMKYLLGDLSEEKQAQIEDAYSVDDDLHEELQEVEIDLVHRYVDNELSEEDREKFERLFLVPPGRRDEVAFARAFKAYTSGATPESPKGPETAKPVWSRLQPFLVPLRYAAMLLISVAVGYVIYRTVIYQSPETKVILALNEAHRGLRPTATRISGLDYGRVLDTRGGDQDKVDRIAFATAEMTALENVRSHPEASSFHALGRVYLAKSSFDDAIIQLEKALELDQTNAQIRNDLGVALFEKARISEKEDERAIQLAESRVQFDKAIELDGSFLAPVFNRALWYEYMSLPDDAEREWRAYLDKDSASGWADEARERLRAIEERRKRSSQTGEARLEDFRKAFQDGDERGAWLALSRSRTRFGNTIAETLLDEFLQFSADGQPAQARSRLGLAIYAGELEVRRAGDRFTQDLVRFYKRTTPARRELVGQARKLVKEGNENSKQTEYEKAVELHTRARTLFERSGDFCERVFAEYRVGSCNLRIDPDAALAILDRLTAECERKGYKWLLAQALLGMSDAESSKRNFSRTLEYSNRSLKLSEEVDDPSGALRNRQLPVAMHQQFGEYAKSSGLIIRALEEAARFSPEPQDLWTFYHQMAFNLHSMNFPTVALSFLRAAVGIAQQLETPIYTSRSYGLLALIHRAMKDYDQAVGSAQLALLEGERIAGEKSRNNLIASSTLNLAHIYRESGDFGNALECYNRAIEIHKALGLDIYKFQAHQGRLSSLIALNDPAAGAEIAETVALVEEYRSRITEESNRNAFFDLAQSIFDIAIDFTYSKMNDPRAAFDYAEASHARSLLDLMEAGAQVAGAEAPELQLQAVARPMDLSEIAGRLPDRAQLLQYAVLDDKLLIWLIARDIFEIRKVDIHAGEIDDKVETFLRLVTAKPDSSIDDVKQRGKELYDILVGPVDSQLDEHKPLYIVPDKSLHHLPFGALVSSETGKYLIEHYALALAPSSTLFVRQSEAASSRVRADDERVLSIGNPRFDRNRFPLPNLWSASHEARGIAGLYKFSSLYLEDDARAAQIKREMPNSDVIHFAGHYVADQQSPMLSKLLMAKVGGDSIQAQPSDEFITISEIYKMNLERTRLVVLSACRTGIERLYRGEGAVGAARPFIKAGVPVVVASLWPVETESTAALMISFHQYRKEHGLSTIESLQRAQQDMLHHPVSSYHHPYFWAGFAVIGGFARY